MKSTETSGQFGYARRHFRADKVTPFRAVRFRFKMKKAKSLETIGTRSENPNSFAIRVEGDSMVPEFIESDIVTFEPGRAAKVGDAVLVKLKDGRLFFKWLAQTGNTVRLESENRRYAPLTFAADEIEFVYPSLEMIRSVVTHAEWKKAIGGAE